MKAFHVSECEIWAATSADEARANYRETTGEQVDEYEFAELSDKELDESIKEYAQDERPTGQMTTLRRYLNETTEPGFLAGYDF